MLSSLDSESSVTMRVIDTPSSSPLSLEPLHQVNAPGYSHASDSLPSKLLSDHDVCHNTPEELQNVYKQPLGPDIHTNVSGGAQQPAEDYSISERSYYNINSSINPSVCATTEDFDAVTRQTMGQHVPNDFPSGHQPIDVGNSLIGNVSSISSSSLLAHLIINHNITNDHESSPLSPEILEGTSLQSTMTSQLPERHGGLSRSLLLKSSHDLYKNDTAQSGSELVADETLTSHVENFACSHKITPIDFAPDHFSISQIDDTKESHVYQAPSPDSVTPDFNSSPPSSPPMISGYIRSSSPMPSSSPVEPSFQTPPASPPSSPVKDTQLDIGSSNNGLLYPITHHKFKNVSMDEKYTKNPLSGFADQPIPSTISPDGSTIPLQHQTSRGANSSNTSIALILLDDATTTNAEGGTGLLNEPDVEQQKLGPNMDSQRLKSMNGNPYPKRPSIAAHRLQQKKLTQPFRSPVLPQASKVESRSKTSATGLRADTVSSCSPTAKQADSQEDVPSSSTTLDSKIKYRTTRAAAQFKSPLSAANMLNDSSLVRLTPTIQALERKLQILKRAVKVREDVQEEVLEGLVKKWTEAGREVAWEVWNLVKDNASSDGGCGNSESGKKRTLEGSWGWESPGDGKKPKGEETERNWGWDVVPICSRNEGEEEEDAPKHTLGTMLMQLGVAADTLGWNDDEASFIDT